VLGRIGADYAAALWRTFPPAPDAPLAADAERFDATGHSIAGAFRAFWRGTDGMTMLGFPLSEPTWEYVGGQMRQVQYFERGRLEHHPEHAGTPGEVTLSNLGRDVALLRNVALSSPPAPVQQAAPVEQAPVQQAAPAPAQAPAAAQQAAPAKEKPAAPARVREKPALPARSGAGGKSIVVDLSQQHLYAYEGETIVFDTAVSTGRDGFNTPPGNFRVYAKLPSQTMEGTIGGEYYRVPNVPSVMYINGGVAIHGTYWHDMFGIRRMSHGCINVPLGAAAWLYKWAPGGTPVQVRN
jgi:lipoprotein-anchoring transpeptidase ErfK/SrfK